MSARAKSAPCVTQIAGPQWQLLASLRLRALAEGSARDDEQFQREVLFTEDQWRRRLRDDAQFVAWLDTCPVGLLGAHLHNHDLVYLYSLWLEPAARGRGLARLLVAAGLSWARARHARVVYLKVAADNAVARSVYTSLGFTLVGDGDPAGELAMAVTVS